MSGQVGGADKWVGERIDGWVNSGMDGDHL